MNDYLEDMVSDVGKENFGRALLCIHLSLIKMKSCTYDALTLHECQQLWNCHQCRKGFRP